MTLDFIPAAKPQIGLEERAAVDAVLSSGQLAQGEEVQKFESEFSHKLLDGRSAIAVSSGTTGLHLGLLAAGVGPGDEVIVPSFTFAATANSVALTGATPVFADIEPDHYTMDVHHAESLITNKTKGIMPVHLYGHPFDAQAFSEVCTRYGISLFEDAAQAHGASLGGCMVGTFGTFAMFSFYPTKNMTSGEGGLVATGSRQVERKMRLLRNQGMEQQYENEVIGFNARMTDLHAAIGRVQLGKLDAWTSQRQANAQFFNQHLIGVEKPKVAPAASHVYHQYTVRIKENRDGFRQALRDTYDIGTGVYYPTPVHRLPSFERICSLPNTDTASAQVLSLPIHPSLTESDLHRVATAVNKLASAGA